MREIKFRAWDKTYGLMNYKVQVGNTDYADQNYTCNSIWVDYGDTKSIGWINADDKCIALMQFTGLKDKNGKEIYEGDILKISTGEKRYVSVNWEVVFEFGAFQIRNPSFDLPASFVFYAYSAIKANAIKNESDLLNYIKVIGNIYENHELLKS
jgi:uncharacterized phage protein (TIGR01671 family)